MWNSWSGVPHLRERENGKGGEKKIWQKEERSEEEEEEKKKEQEIKEEA